MLLFFRGARSAAMNRAHEIVPDSHHTHAERIMMYSTAFRIRAAFRKYAPPLLAGAIGLSLLALAPHIASGAGVAQKDKAADKNPPETPIKVIQTGSRDAADKLSPELRLLVGQYSPSRGASSVAYSPAELKRTYGIGKSQSSALSNPSIEVSVKLKPGAETSTVTGAGANVVLRSGDTVFATVQVKSLAKLSRAPGVQSVNAVTRGHIPSPVPAQNVNQKERGSKRVMRGAPARAAMRTAMSRSRGAAAPVATAFDSKGMTGKGTLVAVIDSGIDWKHKDFINADGTSRVAYLWDPFDDSYKTSGGKIGSAPPKITAAMLKAVGLDSDKDLPAMGTLYTREQITAAIKGKGTVASNDQMGHGTACASVAAGNGLAPGNYKGVAPGADLLVVNVAPPEEDDDTKKIRRDTGAIDGLRGMLGAIWAVHTAKEMGKPVSINMSYGGSGGAHDGSGDDEQVLNQLVGANKKGVSICVSAGNDGNYSFHAGGVFGPKRAGQIDTEGDPIDLFIVKPVRLTAYFKHGEDWGLTIQGRDKFFVTEDKVVNARFYFEGGKVSMETSRTPVAPKNLQEFMNSAVKAASDDKTDTLAIALPPGHYRVWGYGRTANITSGKFDVFLPPSSDASFGFGASRQVMIGDPGTASNVITVASYDFQNSWMTKNNEPVFSNLTVGGASSYTSPGPRRDGVIKPEISAPGQWMISSMSAGSTMPKEEGDEETGLPYITADGQHVVWAGTSASSPFAAGVAALLFQKNTQLDGEQIKRILTSTATSDRHTGATPNSVWGYGKINPTKAVEAVP